ncbi:unnamed protein product [Dibothriocephalus latus]|uniref:Uncharacterized protein n=1 Tax=Dibothriocephalus latus TaxID=60516 RepID=A0A3P6THU7_DIBLA|nr:unnamed protein product [Dibothriocephalus latus]
MDYATAEDDDDDDDDEEEEEEEEEEEDECAAAKLNKKRKLIELTSVIQLKLITLLVVLTKFAHVSSRYTNVNSRRHGSCSSTLSP